MKKAILWSAFLAFSPALLIFMNFFSETEFLFVSLFLFILAFPLILVFSIWPTFSSKTQYWIWSISTITIISLWFGFGWLFNLLGSSTGGAILGVVLIISLGPISLLIIYIVLSGSILRRVLYSQQGQTLWKTLAILMFVFPFAVWFGALPVASLIGDGLIYLSDFL